MAETPVNHLLKFRRWKLTGLGEDLQSGRRQVRVTDSRVRVLSYNLLAPVYAAQHQHLYTRSNPQCLDWSWRWKAIQAEVSLHKPHILTFQEVQFSNSLFFTDIKPVLEQAGYDVISKCRTGGKEDGCAIFYLRDKFSIEASKHVQYNRGEPGILDKDNIAVILCLRSAESGGLIIVATTHLLFSPRRHTVRLAQTALLLAEIDKFSREVSRDSGEAGNAGLGHIPVIVTGDFNCLPSSESYCLLRHGEVEYSSSPAAPPFLPPSVGVADCCQYEDEVRGRLETRGGWLSHELGLRSVHHHRQEVTTFQSDWVTVDYIFYSTLPARNNSRSQDGRREGKLKLVGRLSLPSARQMEVVGSLPNLFSPSDHLPLIAEFLLVK